MDDLISIARWLLEIIAGSGVIVYIAKAAISQMFSRDLERFKVSLAHQHDLEVERLRSDLRKLTYEHETKFGWLHQRRAEVLQELYKKLVEVHRLTRCLWEASLP